MGISSKWLLCSSFNVFFVLFLAVFFNQVASDYGGWGWGQNDPARQLEWDQLFAGLQQQQSPRVSLRPSLQSQVSHEPRSNSLASHKNSFQGFSSGGGFRRLTSTTQRPKTSSTSPRPTIQDFLPPRYLFPATVAQPPVGTGRPTPPPPTQQPPTGNRLGPPLKGRPTTRYSPSQAGPTVPPPPQWGRSLWRGGYKNPTPPQQPSINSALNPYRHEFFLDEARNFNLIWIVDWSTNRITFNVTVRTTGWIGFGFSLRTPEQYREGEIADLIIGGVYPNGTAYFSDRHNSMAQDPFLEISPLDASQDWTLHDSWERGGQTSLSFSRPFDTCDSDDIPITEDSLRILWAYGNSDTFGNHNGSTGIYDAYLLNPDVSPREVLENRVDQSPSSSLKVFNISSTLRLPARNTTYWCTYHKTPTQTKQHITGINVDFPTEIDRSHVHHLLIHRCRAPSGIDPDELFEAASQTSGSECYFFDIVNPQPLQYCRETMYVWGPNGKPFFFPDHVGLPMSETQDEYIAFQVHYDNPEQLANRDVTVTLQAFYTSEVREHDVSMLGIGQNIPAATSIVVPPTSLGHATIGVCPGACTEKGLKGQEVNILAGWLHTHTTGSASRFMHIRGNRELPWILYDDNWNFNYQQFRLLNQERKLIPGDQLIARCEYDTRRRNGMAVAGGFGTREGMCTGYVYYYPRQAGFSVCRTVVRDQSYWDFIKVKHATWDTEQRYVLVTDPPEFAGLAVADHINQNLDWTPEFTGQLQEYHLYGPQVAQCPDMVFAPEMSLQDIRDQVSRQAIRPLPPQQDAEHYAINPRNIPRLSRPPQCSARGNPMPMPLGGYAF